VSRFAGRIALVTGGSSGTGMCEEHIRYMVEKIPMGRLGGVDEVAALVCWLASDECSFSTGGTYDISGGRAVY